MGSLQARFPPGFGGVRLHQYVRANGEEGQVLNSINSFGAPALGGLFSLQRAQANVNTSLTRLATGLRINRAADGPAALIASENLRSQLAGLEAASRNIDRASSVLSVAETGLSEVGSLLGDLDALAVSAANTGAMSDAERRALQIEADSILRAIDRTGVGARFGGQGTLDGSRSFVLSDVLSQVVSAGVEQANLAGGESRPVAIEVTGIAERASVALDFDGASVNLSGPGQFTFELTGSQGSAEISVGNGASLADVVESVNAQSSVTGVEASEVDGRVVLRSSEYGSTQRVEVEITDDGGVVAPGGGVVGFVDGDPDSIDPATLQGFSVGVRASDDGADVEGTINGQAAAGDGTRLRVVGESLTATVELSTGAVGPGQANAVNTGVVSAFTVTGGPTFQITETLGPMGRVGFGLPEISAKTLGRSTGRSIADIASGRSMNLVDGDLSAAQKSIRSAIASVASDQGRIGAFQRNTLAATKASIENARVNISSANSFLRDTDYALEAANLSGALIIQRAAIGAIGAALTQRASVLDILA